MGVLKQVLNKKDAFINAFYITLFHENDTFCVDECEKSREIDINVDDKDDDDNSDNNEA